ncbi:uncharacterized protein LOC110858281 [Folsomia candida]|uniref:Uncharacterized protein n=1 Tax=Folsomia candida TaxID=158441 RepID=A0A226EYH5_FOLCA|nr:uncharacterized protein LOC110858281 [Folsomia candida]OXA61676.1 hypothetical protein Fcan01_02115 [Folsomia candida]
MENKIRRQARKFLELQFKKYDPSMTGALHKKFMSEIVQVLLKEDPDLFNEDQIWEQIEKKSKDSTYITLRRGSKEFVLTHDEETLDWTSVMEVIVFFLKKVEKKNNDGFICKHLVRLTDFPTP